MIKLYLYPNARPHTQDSLKDHLLDDMPQFVNTVPFSEAGIRKHCQLVNPEEADYFYMGQWSDAQEPLKRPNFKYFKGNEKRHIIDIDGDWKNWLIPDVYHDCIFTINGAKKEYSDLGLKMFVRPTSSFLMMAILRGDFKQPINHERADPSFYFRGFPDSKGVRNKMLEAFNYSRCKGHVELVNKWQAKNDPNGGNIKDYVGNMNYHTFSLCPQGAGVDSMRFFESCYFGCIPIVFSCADFPFSKNIKGDYEDAFYIQYYIGEEKKSMERFLNDLNNSAQVLKPFLTKMSINARRYFDGYIKPYYEDPTATFLNWLGDTK